MKKILLSFGFAALIFSACKEHNDLINFRPESESLFIDSSYQGVDTAAQPRNVLIEDFTGVRCPNCPKAQEKAEQIIAANDSGRVIVTAIHVTEQFATPYPESKYNFWLRREGEQIFNMLGEAGALPMGDINRKIFPGKSTAFVAFPEWESKTASELAIPSPLNISFPKIEFNETTRELDVRIQVTYTEQVADTHYISVALKESGMIDIQAQPTGHPDTHYVHNHVLRAMIDPFNGLLLGSNTVPGKTYVVGFKRKLDAGWVAENCTITALVHNRSGKNLEVLQVKETGVK